ncbi:hypothetical protein BEN35_14615 [Streptomyces fradiae]|nr:hypothetical protein BEN35_14615 [Streptomyces fradiae]
MPSPARKSSTLPTPPSSSPSRPAAQPTALLANAEPATAHSPVTARPMSTAMSLSRSTTGLPGSSSFSQTVRRHSRSEPTQRVPTTSSTLPEISPTAPALVTSSARSSRSAERGTCSATCRCSSRTWSGPRSAAVIEAPRLSSGKTAMKLKKVMAAARRSQCTSSSR